MILNDQQIAALAQNGMIEPFVPEKIRKVEQLDVISYGLGHFGYDITLSPKDFRVFRHIPGTVINPKRFNPLNLVEAELHGDEDGAYFIIPGHSYGLGVAVEKLNIPDDVTVIALGKSTYARVGIIANTTPAEAGWGGFLTVEFSNSSPADCRIYANQGVIQLLFFQGARCKRPYGDGKYQDQKQEVTLARV